jgi:hypothetical protein
MKFQHSWRKGGPVSIATAVEARIDDDYDSGVAEHGLSTARNAGSAIGKIVQLLHEKGVLTDEDLKDLVGYSYHPVPDAEA